MITPSKMRSFICGICRVCHKNPLTGLRNQGPGLTSTGEVRFTTVRPSLGAPPQGKSDTLPERPVPTGDPGKNKQRLNMFFETTSL